MLTLFLQSSTLGDVGDDGDPAVNNPVPVLGRNVGCVNPALARAGEIYECHVFLFVSCQHSVYVRSNRVEPVHADDIDNWTADNLLGISMQPVGIHRAGPHVTTVSYT